MPFIARYTATDASVIEKIYTVFEKYEFI